MNVRSQHFFVTKCTLWLVLLTVSLKSNRTIVSSNGEYFAQFINTHYPPPDYCRSDLVPSRVLGSASVPILGQNLPLYVSLAENKIKTPLRATGDNRMNGHSPFGRRWHLSRRTKLVSHMNMNLRGFLCVGHC